MKGNCWKTFTLKNSNVGSSKDADKSWRSNQIMLLAIYLVGGCPVYSEKFKGVFFSIILYSCIFKRNILLELLIKKKTKKITIRWVIPEF